MKNRPDQTIADKARRLNHLHTTIFSMLDAHNNLKTDKEKATAWDSLVEVRKRAVAIVDGVK